MPRGCTTHPSIRINKKLLKNVERQSAQTGRHRRWHASGKNIEDYGLTVPWHLAGWLSGLQLQAGPQKLPGFAEGCFVCRMPALSR